MSARSALTLAVVSAVTAGLAAAPPMPPPPKKPALPTKPAVPFIQPQFTDRGPPPGPILVLPQIGPRPGDAPTDTTARPDQWPTAGVPRPAAIFHVQLLGFRCDRQTRDDILENDGAGDEVLVRNWMLLTEGGRFSGSTSAGYPKIFGSTSRGAGASLFRQAGTASPSGGIRSGNLITTHATVPASIRDIAASPEYMFTLFRGRLTDGRQAVVISPTLWEWDDFGDPTILDDPFPPRWASTWWCPGGMRNRAAELQNLESLPRTRERITERVARFETAAADTAPVHDGSALALPSVEGDMGGNRGIGIQELGDLGIFFRPKALVLNYAMADRIARTDFGNGTGVVAMRYLDDDSFQGDYTLFIRVLRER